MPGFHINDMGEMVLDAIDEIGVIDVYDLATEIRKEYKRLIEKYGTDAVTELMPKIVNALEILEALATKNERENSILQELRDKIAQLESEKSEKAEYRKRFDKELEVFEEQWRTETNELMELVTSLKEENKRLVKQTQDLQSSSAHSSGLGASLTESIISVTNNELHSALTDTQVLQRLKEQIYKQKDELKQRERELENQRSEIENLNIQLECIKTTDRDTRRRYKLLQSQVKTLCEERAEFLGQLQDQHRDINYLHKRLRLAEKENEDLVKSNSDDPSDINRPRYSILELKEIINERDELITTIDKLNEELKTVQQYSKDTRIECTRPTDSISTQNSTPPDRDAPVQGPLPYEPDDAPWKKTSESGIRKIFRKLFSDTSESQITFQKRSLATLSKMALSAAPSNTEIN